MFAATRTPTKKVEPKTHKEIVEQAGPASSKVRTSIGEWESGRISPSTHQDTTAGSQLARPPVKSVADQVKSQGLLTTRRKSAEAQNSPPTIPSYGGSRVAEARACLNRAKTQLNSSRNTRTDIKEAVISAVDRLFQLVKESETDRKEKSTSCPAEKPLEIQNAPQPAPAFENILKSLEEHNNLVKENSERMERLRETLSEHQKIMEVKTYASVAAGVADGKPSRPAPLHSVIVTSEDDRATGDELIEKIRKAVNARDGGIIVDKIRKARDRKVIIGCSSQSELNRVKERIQERGERMQVENMKNKDPMVVLYGALKNNTDSDILEALKKQNKHILNGISTEDLNKAEIRFRRRARNPLTEHVVIKTPPHIWRRLIDAGAVQVDLQRVRVADQSPLIQCSRCLGYGHGRKHCHDAADVCSHCGGQHLRTQCPEWITGTPPNCINCVKSKMHQVEHNAFSEECPIRQKWESLARAAVAYC